ncbi:MAG: hypothetical protein A3E78_14860 [Alphaproteobacteria bacterium RIFCSPHIGHO2_12_FULL_63_12]|nr:MAG: hypothetical protein A3E78_14860 [Alphaproteobacteria bacterium RIFCSPHIGHO2_12_FULL_63_12]
MIYLFSYENRADQNRRAFDYYSRLLKKMERYAAGGLFQMSILHALSKEFVWIVSTHPLPRFKEGRLFSLVRDKILKKKSRLKRLKEQIREAEELVFGANKI